MPTYLSQKKNSGGYPMFQFMNNYCRFSQYMLNFGFAYIQDGVLSYNGKFYIQMLDGWVSKQ